MNKLVIVQRKITFTANGVTDSLSQSCHYRFELYKGFSYTTSARDLVYACQAGNLFASGVDVIIGEIIHE